MIDSPGSVQYLAAAKPPASRRSSYLHEVTRTSLERYHHGRGRLTNTDNPRRPGAVEGCFELTQLLETNGRRSPVVSCIAVSVSSGAKGRRFESCRAHHAHSANKQLALLASLQATGAVSLRGHQGAANSRVATPRGTGRRNGGPLRCGPGRRQVVGVVCGRRCIGPLHRRRGVP